MLLVCLPDGIKIEHLNSLWENRQDIDKAIEYFGNASLLEDNKNKV